MSGALLQLAASETYENMERRLTYACVLLFVSICSFWVWKITPRIPKLCYHW